MLPSILTAVSAYLLGSIPFGFLVGMSCGVDIRTEGSGNIGATNVYRVLGRRPGLATFVLDLFKGIAAVAVVPAMVACFFDRPLPLTAEMIGAVCVLAGHAFPVFLHFKGGKGVATGLGIAIGVAPWTALTALGVWVVLFLLTRYVSVGSIGAAFSAMAVVWWLDNTREPRHLIPAIITVLAIFVIVKHRSNLVRLRRGTENRFTFGGN